MTCDLVRMHASPPVFRWRKVLFHLSGQLNGALTLLAVLVLWLAAAMPAHATPASDGAAAAPELRLEDVGRGELLFRGPNGALMPAPLVQAAYDVEVNGLVATTRLTQSFRNPHPDWMEGVYVFPLPETAAVYGMTLRVGDRTIAAEIQEKQQARATYQQAKAAGKRAGLVEQNRPNIFTTSLANLAPGEEIHVELDYRQTLEYGRDEAGQGGFGLRLPLVVAPRYTPLRSVVVASEQGWAPDPAAIADAAAIAAPVRHPADVSPGTINNPVTIRVALNAGAPIAAIDSRHHQVQ
nr:VIT domain-containing protein [Alphaproteobacteria bacterium]